MTVDPDASSRAGEDERDAAARSAPGRHLWPLVVRVVDWFTGSFPGRLVRRFVAASGYDRALALATQAFVALVPAAMIAIASLDDDRAGGSAIISRLGLSGDAARAVEQLTRAPATSSTSGLVGGIVLIAATGIGFTRALQRLYVAAWALPPLGFRGFLHSLVAVVALVVAIASTIVLDPGGPGAPLTQALVAAALWLPIQRLLLGDRVTLRQLLPGAVVIGVGQTIVTVLSGPFLRAALTSQAERFGAIGVAFVIVSWLLVLAYLLVGAAVLSAEFAAVPMPGPARTVESPATDEPSGVPSAQDSAPARERRPDEETP